MLDGRAELSTLTSTPRASEVPAEGARADANPSAWPDAQKLGGDDADTHGAEPLIRQRAPAPNGACASGHAQSPPWRCRRDPRRL